MNVTNKNLQILIKKKKKKKGETYKFWRIAASQYCIADDATLLCN